MVTPFKNYDRVDLPADARVEWDLQAMPCTSGTPYLFGTRIGVEKPYELNAMVLIIRN